MKYVFITLIFIIFPSSVIQELLGVQVHYIYAFGMLSIVGWLCLRRKLVLTNKVLLLALILLILSSLASVLSTSFSQFLMGATLAVACIVAANMWPVSIDDKSTKFLVTINLLILLGAWFGFFYALNGGSALFNIKNPDQRLNHFYLTTFSNSVLFNYIRPSGVFDEPGALSMFTSLVVIMNELNKGKMKISLILLSMCLITFSLMNLIVLLLYVLLRTKYSARSAIVVTILSASLFVAIDSKVFDIPLLDEFVFSRLKIEDGRLAGDNRSNQVEQFFSLVDMQTTLQGANANKDENPDIDQSSNPFSIYYGYGLLIWLPYVLLELFLVYKAFFGSKDIRFSSVALLLTLLQRPYIYSMYWGVAIMVVMAGIIKTDKDRLDVPWYAKFFYKLARSKVELHKRQKQLSWLCR